MSRQREWTEQEWQAWAKRQPSPPNERTPGARERAQVILDAVARRLLDEELEKKKNPARQPRTRRTLEADGRG
jgi:hypothetical protein